jgi:hypothetical protein
VALTQLLASICYSQPKDVAGWETARWGMFNQELVAAFGTRLQKLPKRMTFLNWHADYVLSREIGGRAYTVFFQMANDTNKLSQVLVRLDEMESHTPREDIFNVLSSSLARDYGKPTANSNDRYRFGAGFKGMALSRTWRFPTTTVELAYGWDDQIFASTLTIRYFPTQATPNNLLQRSAGQRGSQDAS